MGCLVLAVVLAVVAPMILSLKLTVTFTDNKAGL